MEWLSQSWGLGWLLLGWIRTQRGNHRTTDSQAGLETRIRPATSPFFPSAVVGTGHRGFCCRTWWSSRRGRFRGVKVPLGNSGPRLLGVMMMVAMIASVGLAMRRAWQMGIDPEVITLAGDVDDLSPASSGPGLFFILQYHERNFSCGRRCGKTLVLAGRCHEGRGSSSTAR